jgi:ATP-dependent Lhr-like helicase
VGAAGELLELLSTRGACFTSDLVTRTRRLPSDVEEGLWTLAGAGRVTSDSFESLRARVNRAPDRGHRDSRRNGRHVRKRGGFSRWSLLEPLEHPDDNHAAEAIENRARQLLLRYGIVFPELLVREKMAPRWRDLVRIFRRLEARGEIRGGRFVAGFVGEQFALPEAVGLLRDIHRSQPTGQMEVISACDPLNLVGVLTPGDRVPALAGNRIVFRDGVPLAALGKGVVTGWSRIEDTDLALARSLLLRGVADPGEDGNGIEEGDSLVLPELDAQTVLQATDMRFLY